ncbi:MAG: ABC transporter ATP-binding protein [Anaerolineae bacterium]|nr:ABC transporter ATP-binding protein [Anaerolineae bacterium]
MTGAAAANQPVPLLAVRDLRVYFSPAGQDGPPVRAVDAVSFDLADGAALGIVGETASGKTSIARALLGLHPPGSTRGSIRLTGQELVDLLEEEWRPIRWRRVAMAAQSSGSAFDPLYRLGEQIAEPLRAHLGLAGREAQERVEALARRVGLEPRHLRAYPHQLSGGEKQRAMLAMALCCGPELLVLDEPTSGQDVLSRARLIDLLDQIRQESGAGLLLISHDLAAVARLTGRVAVLYAGKLVEVGPTAAVLAHPRHPYTWGLLNAYPNMTTARDLRGIRGRLPDPADPPPGCRFHPRCTQAVERCRHEEPPLALAGDRLVACHLGGLQTLLRADGLRKVFSGHGRPGPEEERVEAVREASLELLEGEVVALVGETGSGKTTLGRLLVGLLQADGGRVVFEGQDLAAASGRQRKALQRRIQLVAQDPFDAVSPRLTVAEIVREPLDVQKVGPAAEREEKVRRALQAVGLPVDPAFLTRRAHELSGGQLQRVAIARALVLDPKLIVADEPVSMLDASEQAKLINLLKEIQNERGMGLLLISHDLALVRKVADRIVVMRDGEIVEEGLAGRVVAQPRHPYTRALLEAAPAFAWEDVEERDEGGVILEKQSVIPAQAGIHPE